jgi:hypothetical protein
MANGRITGKLSLRRSVASEEYVMKRLAMSIALLMIPAWLFGSSLLADPPLTEKKPELKKTPAPRFLRLQRDEKKQPVALETSVVRYVPAMAEGDLTVDLVAAVHIGDRDYYKKLNKQFQQYDVVLYELVAPPGTRIPKGGKRDLDPLGLLMQVVKSVLELELQTERIDYTKKNFVHADLSPSQMAEAVRKRGDDGLTLFLGITADMLRQQNLREANNPKNPPRNEEEIDIISLLLDPDGPVKLKRMLAQQFEDLQSPTSGLGQTLSTILVADRNEAALKVFQKELAKGKKKIAIFYGAAHMPDFDKRLRADFGLKPKSEQWLTAWDLED